MEDKNALSWTNPLVAQRADPHVLLHTDGYYYLTATVPEYDRIELRRAPSLAGLTAAEPLTLWRRHETGAMGAHIWAPELHYIEGTWYLYFAAGDAEDIWHIRPYVLECTASNPLLGPWRERGRIETAWDAFSLDATTFTHRGKRYLAWAQNLPPRSWHRTVPGRDGDPLVAHRSAGCPLPPRACLGASRAPCQ